MQLLSLQFTVENIILGKNVYCLSAMAVRSELNSMRLNLLSFLFLLHCLDLRSHLVDSLSKFLSFSSKQIDFSLFLLQLKPDSFFLLIRVPPDLFQFLLQLADFGFKLQNERLVLELFECHRLLVLRNVVQYLVVDKMVLALSRLLDA